MPHIDHVALQHYFSPMEARMAKSNTTANGAETIESALHTSAEAMKDGFEKVSKNYEQIMTFGKDNTEAVIKAATAAGKGIETINGQIFAYMRKSLEDGMSATKAVVGAKSVDEALHLQSEFGKNAFQVYVDEMAKFGETALSITKSAAMPLQARASAFAEAVSRPA
jgi:phasin family protein